jgi:hypothetical protein
VYLVGKNVRGNRSPGGGFSGVVGAVARSPAGPLHADRTMTDTAIRIIIDS